MDDNPARRLEDFMDEEGERAVQREAGLHLLLVPLVSIVRDLAALDCTVTIPVSWHTDETAVVCITCEEEAPRVWDEKHHQWDAGPITHTKSCPWRRAREWVRTHP